MIRRYFTADHQDVVRMMGALFPEQTPWYVTEYLNAVLARTDTAVLVEERMSVVSRPLGGFIIVVPRAPFADVSDVRSFAYVEAWYVDEDLRGKGRGVALMRAAEDWAHSCGFREIASDVEHDNHLSRKVHERCGFTPGNQTVHFRKELAP